MVYYETHYNYPKIYTKIFENSISIFAAGKVPAYSICYTVNGMIFSHHYNLPFKTRYRELITTIGEDIALIARFVLDPAADIVNVIANIFRLEFISRFVSHTHWNWMWSLLLYWIRANINQMKLSC